MNSNKFVYSVIAVLISVVFIGSCLAPVVMDAVTGDKQTITLSNDDTGATTFVYKLAAADSIVGNISTGEYTITAGGTDYTTTTDPLLINPNEGIIAPDIQNGKIVVYSSEGVAEELPIEKITKVVASKLTTWILTENGKVYGCGDGSRGQQGSGTTSNVTTFTDRTPEGKTVVSVVAVSVKGSSGNYYYGTTWIVTQDGKVYGCGEGTSGQQGSGDTSDVTTFTDRTPEGKTVVSVECNAATDEYYGDTYLLTSDGIVYRCGESITGSSVSTFTAMTGDLNVTHLYTAFKSAWVITQDGKVYGCGYGRQGQQGSGDTSNVTTFTDRTPEGKTVVSVAVSNVQNIGAEYHGTTWLLTQDGKVYGCGEGTNGQQGSGTTSNVTTFTDRTPEGKTVVSVGASIITTWIVTQDGKVYGCGEGSNGQQGSDATDDVTTLTDRTPSGTLLKIEDKADYYLITDAADIPNQYLYITDASTGYYADPTKTIVFGTAASSYFVSVGATVGSHYGTLPTLATVNGTDTQLSPGYHVYQYSDSFPVTADGVSTGLAGFVDLEYQGEVGQGGLDPTFGTLLVLTVTFAIIGVVLAAVRMIGGRE